MHPTDAPPTILLAHPIAPRRDALSSRLARAGYACLEEADGIAAWHRFRRCRPDAVCSAARLPGLDGVELLSRVRDVSAVPFLIEIETGDVASAVAALRRRADDVVEQTRPIEEIGALVESATAKRSAEAVLAAAIPGRSAPIRTLRERLVALGRVSVPVLFRGEPGSGRAHAAASLAASAGSPPGTFETVEAGSPERTLPKRADGVIFLRDVSRFSRSEQARWSNAIRGGSDGHSPLPQRITASSDADLRPLAEAGRFDGELAGFLSRFVVEVPPLRSTLQDLRPLVERIAGDVGSRVGRHQVVFTARAIGALQAHPWPGNVRQLRSVVEQLVAYSPDGTVTKGRVEQVLAESASTVSALRRATSRRQREELVAALRESDGNLAEVARRLGMSRGAIIYRSQKFGLLPERRRRPGVRPDPDRSS